eukprot:c12632_g1_i1 orf=467-2320(+)
MDEKGLKKVYPTGLSSYELIEELAHGQIATVYRALCLPYNEVVVIKSLNFGAVDSALDSLSNRLQTTRLMCHTNVMETYCSFVVNQELWIVMPFMERGSCQDIMRVAYKDGFEEPAVAAILRDILKALEYLHSHDHVHKGVKVGNVLIDASGTVKLADCGISSSVFGICAQRNISWQSTRLFAPEVFEPSYIYDCKADIWSFGVTALDLARGTPTLSTNDYLMTDMESSPSLLDEKNLEHLSKPFRDLARACLFKDPTKRPTAEMLLNHPFFEHACSGHYLVKHILDPLPLIWEHARRPIGKISPAAGCTKPPTPSEHKDRSTSLHRQKSGGYRCTSDLKSGATTRSDEIMCKAAPENRSRTEGAPIMEMHRKDKENHAKLIQGDKVDKASDLDRKGSGGIEENRKTSSTSLPNNESRQTKVERKIERQQSLRTGSEDTGISKSYSDEKLKDVIIQTKGRFAVTNENVHLQPLVPPPRKPFSNGLQQVASSSSSTATPQGASSAITDTTNVIPASAILPQLQDLLQFAISQQDQVLCLISSLDSSLALSASSDQPPPDREQKHLQQIADLQARIVTLTEELHSLKLKNAQLEHKLNAFYNKEEEARIRKEESEDAYT